MTWASAGGTGSVTSVALTTPSFLTTTGSPITTSGTLAITLSGTALPVTSGGTGTTTSTGTGSTVLNTSPTFTTQITTPKCIINNTGSAQQLAVQQNTAGYGSGMYFSNFTDGNTFYSGLDGTGFFGLVTGAGCIMTGTTKPIILGCNSLEVVRVNTKNTSSTSTTTGALIVKGGIASDENISSASLNLQGSSSGIIAVRPQPAAGTYNFNLPTTAGTLGQVLTSAGGVSSPMTWSGVPKTSWTPTLAGFGGSGGITITYSTQGGWYSVHNNLVTVYFTIVFDYGSNLVNRISINNCPYTPTTTGMFVQDASITNWAAASNPLYTIPKLTGGEIQLCLSNGTPLSPQVLGAGGQKVVGHFEFYI